MKSAVDLHNKLGGVPRPRLCPSLTAATGFAPFSASRIGAEVAIAGYTGQTAGYGFASNPPYELAAAFS
jgi:hypothetical protein